MIAPSRNQLLYVASISLIAALGGFLLGFDGAVISGAAPFYKKTFSVDDTSLLFGFSVSAIIWGSILGNVVAGPLADSIGRKRALIVCALLFIASSALVAFAGDISVFIIGRTIAGIAVGIAILTAPLYIGEISPEEHRGWLVSFNQLMIVVGLSLAYCSNYIILSVAENLDINWRWMMGIEIIPSIVYLLLLFVIPESPRWLLLRARKEQAKSVLTKIGGVDYAHNELENIAASLTKAERAILRQASIFFSLNMKTVLIVGFGLAIFQQVSGINAILYYAPMVFEITGTAREDAFIQAAILGAVFFITTIIAMFLIDSVGRRRLLLAGTTLMSLSLLTASGIFYFEGLGSQQHKLILLCILSFIGGFSISLGPVTWTILAEIFPTRIRGVAMSVTGFANSLTSFAVATFFPVQLALIGSALTFLIYGILMIACLFFVLYFVPETKGKSLEQLEKELIH